MFGQQRNLSELWYHFRWRNNNWTSALLVKDEIWSFEFIIAHCLKSTFLLKKFALVLGMKQNHQSLITFQIY